MTRNEQIIFQTKNWIEKVIIGLNFCPFAGREFMNDTIRYVVVDTENIEHQMERFMEEVTYLDEDPATETTLVILPQTTDFEVFLEIIVAAEYFIEAAGYEGVYQLASFHPDYIFEGADDTDAANYTNRSPYATLHLLREASVEKAINLHPNTDEIPERNIEMAEKKGLEAMKKLLENALHLPE